MNKLLYIGVRERMSRDNDHRKGELRSGFRILTTRQLILRDRPAAFFLTGDKM
jgi:hypothetical protein